MQSCFESSFGLKMGTMTLLMSIYYDCVVYSSSFQGNTALGHESTTRHKQQQSLLGHNKISQPLKLFY